jgi:glycosyltransferase involved in cell wall biosynthesis
MFSVIIPTADSERPLVPTLAALVPGATAGLVREVIVTDAQSRDQTGEVADIAGCRFSTSSKPLGTRLTEAAQAARGDWLMFLRPGSVPGPAWVDETLAFLEQAGRRDEPKAAVFQPDAPSILALLGRALQRSASPRQGLMIAKAFYLELGGHSAGDATEVALLRRIGRRRIVTLRTPITQTYL